MSLNKNLHSSTKTKYKMKSRLLLDVVVRESSAVLKLLSSEDKALLIGWNSLLVLNLSFYIVNGIRRLNVKGDGLAGKGLNKNLHSSTKTKYKMKSRFLPM